MNTGYLGSALLLSALLFAGCLSGTESAAGSSTSKLNHSSAKIRQHADTIPYQMVTYELQSNWVSKDSTETVEPTYFSASYPQFGLVNLDGFVKRSLLGADSPDLEETAQTFIQEYEEYQETLDFVRTWSTDTKVTVQLNSTDYVALQTDVYSYTGGAHGNYATLFYHYSIADKKELFFHDFIGPDDQFAFQNVAEVYFWMQEQEYYGEDFSQNNYFFDNGFYAPENMAFEQDSLLLLYNIYEIKPYVYGHTELRVPYSELDHVLTDRAKGIIQELKRKIKHNTIN